MCGRFVGFTAANSLQEQFPIDIIDAEVTSNYNVAPTQEILAIVRHGDKNHLEKLYWGLVPFCAKDIRIGNRILICIGRKDTLHMLWLTAGRRPRGSSARLRRPWSRFRHLMISSYF